MIPFQVVKPLQTASPQSSQLKPRQLLSGMQKQCTVLDLHVVVKVMQDHGKKRNPQLRKVNTSMSKYRHSIMLPWYIFATSAVRICSTTCNKMIMNSYGKE